MYKVKFYRTKNGESEIVNFLDDLKQRGLTSKTDRINHDKIFAHIGALEWYGIRIGEPVVAHIEGGIWERRPFANRIFFFYWKYNNFVLLHHITKKTRKTPPLKVENTRTKMKDFIERNGK